MNAPMKVFFSYAHKDENLRDELAVHLAILKRQGKIGTWHDRQITAGQEWAGEIDDNLNTADVILLLVSPTFVASDYCWDVELKRAIERHEAHEARVVPIILRPVDWSDAPFAKLQALPKNAKPVTTWSNRDEAFLNVAEGLRAAIEDEQKRRASRPATASTAAPALPEPPLPTAEPPPPAAAPPTAPEHPQLDCRTLRDLGLLDALATVFDTEAAAVGVLEQAGVPKGRLQSFGLMTPIQYWASVCRELEKGLIAGGLAALVREAANAYPYNPTFQQGLQLAAGTPVPATPAPASGTAAASQAGTPGTGAGPLAIWREKLTDLLREEAIASDAAQKFTLKKQIEEARAKIRQLGGP